MTHVCFFQIPFTYWLWNAFRYEKSEEWDTFDFLIGEQLTDSSMTVLGINYSKYNHIKVQSRVHMVFTLMTINKVKSSSRYLCQDQDLIKAEFYSSYSQCRQCFFVFQPLLWQTESDTLEWLSQRLSCLRLLGTPRTSLLQRNGSGL